VACRAAANASYHFERCMKRRWADWAESERWTGTGAGFCCGLSADWLGPLVVPGMIFVLPVGVGGAVHQEAPG
jgi:hypothetical protein